MNILISMLLSAIAGGILCLIAQILIDTTRLTPARILVFYVSVGVLLYAIGIYDALFDIFGAGVSLPLIGFGATIGRGVREAIDESGLLGILTGGLTATSAGITFSLLLGLLASFLASSRPKRM